MCGGGGGVGGGGARADRQAHDWRRRMGPLVLLLLLGLSRELPAAYVPTTSLLACPPCCLQILAGPDDREAILPYIKWFQTMIRCVRCCSAVCGVRCAVQCSAVRPACLSCSAVQPGCPRAWLTPTHPAPHSHLLPLLLLRPTIRPRRRRTGAAPSWSSRWRTC